MGRILLFAVLVALYSFHPAKPVNIVFFGDSITEYANPQNKENGILTKDGVHLNDEGNKQAAALFYPLLVK